VGLGYVAELFLLVDVGDGVLVLVEAEVSADASGPCGRAVGGVALPYFLVVEACHFYGFRGGCGVSGGEHLDSEGAAADEAVDEYDGPELAEAYASDGHHGHAYAHEQQGVGEALCEQQPGAYEREHDAEYDAVACHVAASFYLVAAHDEGHSEGYGEFDELGGQNHHSGEAHAAARAVDGDACHEHVEHGEYAAYDEPGDGFYDVAVVEVLYDEHYAESGDEELGVAHERAVDVVDAHFLAGGAEQFDDGEDEEHDVYAPDVVVGAQSRAYDVGLGGYGGGCGGRVVRHFRGLLRLV
jgi:hypothetical protein